MKTVYISGPFSSEENINTRNAVLAADTVLSLGFIPYIPHLTILWSMISPKPYYKWIEIDLEWVRRCDIFLRLPGDSSGADVEEKCAMSNNIPIYHGIEDFAKDARELLDENRY